MRPIEEIERDYRKIGVQIKASSRWWNQKELWNSPLVKRMDELLDELDQVKKEAEHVK